MEVGKLANLHTWLKLVEHMLLWKLIKCVFCDRDMHIEIFIMNNVLDTPVEFQGLLKISRM